MKQLSLLPPREGDAFRDGTHTLKIMRIVGNDAAAPVIVDDHGQLAIWSQGDVTRAQNGEAK